MPAAKKKNSSKTVEGKKKTTKTNEKKSKPIRPPPCQIRRLVLNNINNNSETGPQTIRTSPSYLEAISKFHKKGLKKKVMDSKKVALLNNKKRLTVLLRDYDETKTFVRKIKTLKALVFT